MKGRWSWGHKRSSGFSTTPCCQLMKSDFSKQMQIIPRFDDNTTCVTFCSQLKWVCCYTWGLEEVFSFLTQLQSAEWQAEQKKWKELQHHIFLRLPVLQLLSFFFFFFGKNVYISQQRHNSNKWNKGINAKNDHKTSSDNVKSLLFCFLFVTQIEIYTHHSFPNRKPNHSTLSKTT